MARVKVYTTRVCPYCDAAKRLLAQLEADYEEVPLDDDPELRRRLSAENQGWRTVPMIFVGDEFVGGFTELQRLHWGGELAEMLSRE